MNEERSPYSIWRAAWWQWIFGGRTEPEPKQTDYGVPICQCDLCRRQNPPSRGEDRATHVEYRGDPPESC